MRECFNARNVNRAATQATQHQKHRLAMADTRQERESSAYTTLQTQLGVL